MFPFNFVTGRVRPRNTNLAEDIGAPPGTIREVVNDDGSVRYDVRLFNATGGALTAGRPYIIAFGPSTEPLVAIVPITQAFATYVVIALEATPDNEQGWFAIAGEVQDVAFVKTAAGAVGDGLEVINAGVHLIEDGGSGTARTTTGVGILREAETADSATGTADIYLFGIPVTIAAA